MASEALAKEDTRPPARKATHGTALDEVGRMAHRGTKPDIATFSPAGTMRLSLLIPA